MEENFSVMKADQFWGHIQEKQEEGLKLNRGKVASKKYAYGRDICWLLKNKMVEWGCYDWTVRRVITSLLWEMWKQIGGASLKDI